MIPDTWIAERMGGVEITGVRQLMELAAKLKDPVNLSIGQPDFPVPAPIKNAVHQAIDRDQNGYVVAPGLPELRTKILADVRRLYPAQADRDVLITNGSSGGLVLALMCSVNPGDEVIFFDPYFIMYPLLASIVGARPVVVDTYPDYRIDIDKVRAALTPRTKAIIVNSPANPTGVVHSPECLRDLARLAQKHNILLVSDEVYRIFCYDQPFVSPAQFNDDVLVCDGFSKAYSMTGWRLGWCHGPRRLIEEMIKLQQFMYVCAPSVVQHGGVAALDLDMAPIIADYRQKRDRMVNGLKDRYDIAGGQGAFYLFPGVPKGTSTEFVAEAIRHNLLIFPGKIFSRSDTHFRLSYAASDAVLDRGIEILRRLGDR